MNVPAQTVQFEITDLQPTFLDYIQSQKDENTRTFNIQFLFEGDVLSLSGCTATATVTINNIMVEQELDCEVNEINNYVTVVINAPYSGVMAVQVTLASGNDILTMPRPLYIRVTQDIAETAQIDDNTHGSFAEVVHEIAEARGTYTTLHDAIEDHGAIPYSVKLAMDALFSKAAYADDDAASSYVTFHAWAISNLVTFITAVFTQGPATIHDTDSLDTLKRYLTVTATYSDSTTATVTDYTLSGTLTEGTSTITVSYGGKTTTFSVTVTEDDGYSVKYQGNFTTASPSNTRVTLITNDVTLSEGETVTFSVPSGYKIFALQSYATGGNSAIDRTAKDVNKIYVNYVSSLGYTVPKDTVVCQGGRGFITSNKSDWDTEVTYTKGSGTATVSGIGFFVQKVVNEEAVELSISEAKSVVSIAYA